MELRTKNPAFRETILRHLERQEFMKHIGCRLTVIEPGYVEAVIDLDIIHQQQIGLVHGGVTATIADVAAGFAGLRLWLQTSTPSPPRSRSPTSPRGWDVVCGPSAVW